MCEIALTGNHAVVASYYLIVASYYPWLCLKTQLVICFVVIVRELSLYDTL